MDTKYFKEKKFDGINYTQEKLEKGEYEKCIFDNCIFSKVNLIDFNFVDCEFKICDLSMAKVLNTAFRDVKFTGCKLFGLHFEDCNKFVFAVVFDGCRLNLSSFYKLSLKNITFKDCNLKDVDFTESNLSGMIFENCNLTGAIFENSNLEKADFRTSVNFSINPENNRVNKAKFTFAGALGLLDKYNIVIE